MAESGYFPYRAHKNRPYITEFLKLPAKEKTWDALVQICLARTRQAFGSRETIKADVKLSQAVHTCAMHESWLSSALADFFNGGQVVFHVSPALKEAFRHSDLGDATARDLKFPFPNSYIHLGIDEGLRFNGGRTLLEGVMLSERAHRDGKSVSMTLVGRLVDAPAHWGERGMETFTFHFGSAEMDLPLLNGAQKYLEDFGRVGDQDESSLADLDEVSRKDVLDAWSTQAQERSLHLENIPVALECVRMVANALLYVSQYPDDMTDDYQDGFPAGFREKIERSDGKTAERTLSKARNMGFTLIKRVGAVFDESAKQEAAEDGEGRAGPSPHLRRAHWRRQAYGAGNAQKKLIWIRVARVLGGTVRERPYLVKDDVINIK